MTVSNVSGNQQINQTSADFRSVIKNAGKIALTISKVALPILLGAATAFFVGGPMGLALGGLALVIAGVFIYTISRSKISTTNQTPLKAQEHTIQRYGQATLKCIQSWLKLDIASDDVGLVIPAGDDSSSQRSFDIEKMCSKDPKDILSEILPAEQSNGKPPYFSRRERMKQRAAEYQKNSDAAYATTVIVSSESKED
ncbi:MAG: hypothetical protein WD595_01910 [Waddliaceae bacterium]